MPDLTSIANERRRLVARRAEVVRLWRYNARHLHRREQLVAERDYIDQQLGDLEREAYRASVADPDVYCHTF